jgi:hypothetical protein
MEFEFWVWSLGLLGFELLAKNRGEADLTAAEVGLRSGDSKLKTPILPVSDRLWCL